MPLWHVNKDLLHSIFILITLLVTTKKRPELNNYQISFKDVTLRYNDKIIFDNFNWNVAKGDKIIIQGPSGIGKTSLFRLILGFVKPQAGKIYFNGQPIAKSNIWEVRKLIGYVGQDLMLGEGTVDDLLNDVLGYETNKKLHIHRSDIAELMQEFSLSSDHFKEQIGDLSGGEKQRMAIIVSLLLNRPVYLLDEITSALDDALKQKIAQYFMKLDKTILVISHDPVWDNYDVEILMLKQGSTVAK